MRRLYNISKQFENDVIGQDFKRLVKTIKNTILQTKMYKDEKTMFGGCEKDLERKLNDVEKNKIDYEMNRECEKTVYRALKFLRDTHKCCCK